MTLSSQLEKNFKYKPEDENAQLEYYVEFAQQGSLDAQAYLAFSAILGIGAQKDAMRGRQLLENLCTEGSCCANLLMGRILFKEQAYNDAFSKLQKANEIDATMANYDLAICYMSGNGIDKNPEKAKEFLKKAIDYDDHPEKAKSYLEKMNKPSSEKGQGATFAELLKNPRNRIPAIGAGLALVALIGVTIAVRLPSTSSAQADKNPELAAEIKQDTTSARVTELASKYLIQFESNYKLEAPSTSEAASCYANALANLSYGLLPVGIKKGQLDNTFSSYAICDVDKDEQPELILINEDSENLHMSEYVCGYDASTGGLVVEFDGLPYVKFFSNGSIKSISNTAKVMAKEFEPYKLYAYDSDKGKFKEQGYIEKWDKSISSIDASGEKFPNEKDLDGDGVLYLVYDSDYEKNILDNTEFEEYLSKNEGESSELTLTYTDLLPAD